MLPKPPRWQDGVGNLHDHADHLDLLETTLRSRFDREWYRRDLTTALRRYVSLARGRIAGSDARRHFEALGAFYAARLERYGPEPAPKKRTPKVQTYVPLVYPNIPDALTLRVHCMEIGSFRRDRAASMARYADHLSWQVAPDGKTLISIAVHPDQARFFEHLMEVVGPDGNLPRLRGSFQGWVRSNGSKSAGRDFGNAMSPWRRMADDNQAARLYHWNPRRAVDHALVHLPPIPWIPDELPWDPDPRFRAILAATEANDLALAMDLLRAVPGTDREPDFGEVIYLAFLVGEPPRGDDLRYLARKHVASSSLRASLEEDFGEYIELLDAELVEAGPQRLYLGIAGMDRGEFAVDAFAKATPSIDDWPAMRRHYRKALDVYGHPIAPRGRVFAWHPGVGHHDLGPIMRTFAPLFIAAENAFRRGRGIPEIGRGWSSEAALLDLVREHYPDAIHQWRPHFLGQQSIDVYVPSLNLAIEYQGEQHYRPVLLFGGEEGLAATQERDKRKRQLLLYHGVSLFEWRFDRDITRENVHQALCI